MSRRSVLLLLLGFLLPLNAVAAEFALDRGKVAIDVPTGWESVENLFGMQLMVLGPLDSVSGARPAIGVTATGQEDWSFDEAALRKSEKEYQDGRGAWLKKLKGKALEFFHYETQSFPASGLQAHVIGFRYELNGHEFIEKSYYVTCKSKLFHLKTLLRAKHRPDVQAATDRALRSFSCR